MKMPIGHKIRDLEIAEPRAKIVIDQGKTLNHTGFIRVTYEKEGINDFHLFFVDGQLMGVYGEEMLTEKEVYGKHALEEALTIFSRGIAGLYTMEKQEVATLLQKEPDLKLEKKELGFTELVEAQLRKLNKEGSFMASLVADVQGLPIAAVDSEYSTERIAALSALVQDASHRAETQLGFKKMDEVSLVDDDKVRLVCRYFKVGNNTFVLSCVVPAYQAYRRLTNTAIKEISTIMEKRFS
ncbi:MAG: DUF2226 domain-containing protein [Candidatus Methanofastidiosia archaeon]|jgi:predicted regulator of Ras-like GTPase activity (Roadblock/LC7/MglB family)